MVYPMKTAAVSAALCLPFSILLTLTTSATSESNRSGPGETKSKSTKKKQSSATTPFLPPGQCALYLAPSTLPNANLGLYAGTNIPLHHSINEYLGGTFPGYEDEDDPPLWTDLYIVISDDYKTLPFRGQQRFPSWLSYVWPRKPGAFFHSEKPFPDVPLALWEFDEGLNMADGLEFYMNDEKSEGKVSALVPGIASLANSHPRMSNLERIYENSKMDYAGMAAPWDAGAGAFAPHHTVEFKASKEVKVGMEILLNYGAKWHSRRNAKKKGMQKSKRGVLKKKGFVEGIDKKWDQLDEREKENCPEELPTEKGKRDRLEVGMAVDSSELNNGGKPYSSYRENTHHPYADSDDDEEEDDDEDNASEKQEYGPSHPDHITMSLSWLNENGICLSSGKLRLGKSSIPNAGRGLLSTTQIEEGEVVVSSPVIAMRRDDFKIYKSDPHEKLVRKILDKSTVIGEELLLNYAYGHPESSMLLVPTAPLANFINHGGPFVADGSHGEGANVRIQWPESDSNTAKLFKWVFNNHGNAYKEFDEGNDDGGHNLWLNMHPIDVMERSGKLAFDYVALRDIRPGEEILIDYGPLWDIAWNNFKNTHPYSRSGYFRHEIGVPPYFYPANWRHVSDKYELAEIKDLENKPLELGKVVPLTWAHNGKPISSKYAYVVGLPKGFSDKFLEYSESKGVVELYRRLLTEQEGFHLPSDGFGVYRPESLVENSTVSDGMEFFAHRYHSDQWNFNMHFVAAWDEPARTSVLSALGDAGFNYAVKGLGQRFGYDNLTCFHASYMGMTHCDKSKMHSDIYATDDKSWNIVFPLIVVEGTDPELDILAEDMNTVIGVHYLKDVAYAIGDFGYHQTRPSEYYDPSVDKNNEGDLNVPIRVVFGAYCSQIDKTNVAMIRHIYDGDDPAPFADQFINLPMKEIHWSRSSEKASLENPALG